MTISISSTFFFFFFFPHEAIEFGSDSTRSVGLMHFGESLGKGVV